ncbi:DUF4129 domain-containing protein [Halorussus caseinilyticus]|uniref:DUF4129 domain-containing protein n=1 Tax=Halorussus caseinilyticus TaxID=3034025 RepID=A0ABD5WJ83_9EURY|nr:DUF4129 domain-containing protein [Halorussus sp. DT72]
MKADTVLTAVVALCCVLAIGATSTTLDSTVSTDPEEVTEVDYDEIPIGTGQAKNLDDAIDGGKSGSGDSNGGSGSESVGAKPSDDGQRTGAKSKPDDGQRNKRAGSGDGQRQQSAGSGDRRNQGGGSGSKSQSGAEQTLREPSLLERLLSLLRDLFDLLLGLLALLVLLAVVAAAVRFRDRLLSRVSSSPSRDGDDETREPDPQNEIASAWFEMVERLDLGDRRDLTPRECAAAARRRGVDADAAQTLTSLFEEVRYGGARVTDERRQRAERNLDRVRSQLEVQQ